MPTIHVSAVQRENHPGAWRAGRFWPSNAHLAVEYDEQKDEDPELSADDKQKAVIRIGKKSYKALSDDRNIVIRQPGDPVENQKTLEQLKAENASLKAQLAALGHGSPKGAEATDEQAHPRARKGG